MERAHLPNLKGFVSFAHICLTRFVCLFVQSALCICSQKELQQTPTNRTNAKYCFLIELKNPFLKGQSINAHVLKDGGCLSLPGNEEENVPIHFNFVFSPVGNQ